MKKIFQWVFLLATGVLLTYVWVGFLFPDPYYFDSYSFIGKLKYSWLPLFLIPLTYLALIFLLLTNNRKNVRNGILTVALSVVGLVLISYPLLDIKYYLDSKRKNTLISDQYHSFLQLNPQEQVQLDSLPDRGTLKIFCLGGSTTEFKDSHGEGWPEKLEKELRSEYSTDSIFVLNLGRQWYTTLHSLINYEVNLRQYKPDVIILMHSINDLLQNADFSYLSKGEFREDYGHFLGPSANIFKSSGLFGSNLENLKHTWYQKPRITITQDSFPGLLSFERNINSLIDLARVDNVKFILLTQPNIYSENMSDELKRKCIMINFEAVGKYKQWDFQTGYKGMLMYQNKIKEISETRNVYYIDLENRIPKSLVYFTDEVHYRDTTFTLISEILADEISRMDIIPFVK